MEEEPEVENSWERLEEGLVTRYKEARRRLSKHKGRRAALAEEWLNGLLGIVEVYMLEDPRRKWHIVDGVGIPRRNKRAAGRKVSGVEAAKV